jgi:rubrerythrin
MAFSTKELIDIAVGIEDSGYYFYTKCREKFDDKVLKELFYFLAEEEMRHKEFFEKLDPALLNEKGIYTTEYFQYLTAIGDEKVFKDKNNIDSVIKNINSPLDAIKIALTAEKDSILFYDELKELYKNEQNTFTILNKIINEERRHVIMLLDIREKIIITE